MMPANSSTQNAPRWNLSDGPFVCKHCGDPIGHTQVSDEDGGIFCCTGCAAVYRMLQDNDWNFYYHLLSLQKKNPPSAVKRENYGKFLESVETTAFLKSHGKWEGTIHTITLQSDAITCSACGWLLEKMFSRINGITYYSVDFLHATVRLSYDSKVVNLKSILEKSWEIGYPLKPAINLDGTVQKDGSGLVSRIVVAGACFMNVMIFSLAGYFGLFKGISEVWREFFNWLNLLLTIPVVTYSASTFYNKALGGLKQGLFHMDVPVSAGIIFAFTISIAATIFGWDWVYYDSAAGLVFFLLIGRWGTQRFEQSLTTGNKFFEHVRQTKVRVVRKTDVHYLDTSHLKPGDLILLAAGEFLPVDGTVAAPEAWLDTSLLTGESKPVKLVKNDRVFSGYKNLVRDLPVLTATNVPDSRVEELERRLQQLSESKKTRKNMAEKIAPWFSIAVLITAAAAFIAHLPHGLGSASRVLVSVLIVSCPCALALAVPLSSGIAMARARKLGFFIKSQELFQLLKNTGTILFDKTGTLTYSERGIRKWEWLKSPKEWQSDFLPFLKKLCRQSLHPVSRTLLESLSDVKETEVPITDFEELPHLGIRGVFREKGTITLCRYPTVNDPDFRKAGIDTSRIIPNRTENPPDACILLNNVPVGFLTFTEEIKPSVRELVSHLSSEGVRTILVSGDNHEKVKKFNHKVGFKEWHARQSPEDKLAVLDRQKSFGDVIMALGDGYNDALLLGAADISMVVHGGAQSLGGKADILFIQQDFGNIRRLLHLAKSIPRAVKANYTVSIAYNAIAVGLAAGGFVAPIVAAVLMPLSSFTVCALSFFTVKRHFE